MDDIVEGNDIGVPQVTQEGCLPDGREWSSFFLLEPDFLESYDLLSQAII